MGRFKFVLKSRLFGGFGGMREWSNRLAWKATRRESGTRVRTPLPPPGKMAESLQDLRTFFLKKLVGSKGAGTTVPSRGQVNRQQAGTRDRTP